MKKSVVLSFLLVTSMAYSQTLRATSNEATLDFSDPKRNYNSSIPLVVWVDPKNEVSFLKDGRTHLEVQVTSKNKLKELTLSVMDKETNKVLATKSFEITPENALRSTIDMNLSLQDGVNLVEVAAVNVDGVKGSSTRSFHVGATALADAANLGRKDYALVFVTDEYDNFKHLVNPVYDGRSIANELRDVYGFETDVVENPTQNDILVKLREYAEKKYQPLDQLLIFIAGHGFYDETFKEGFVVTKESLLNDQGRTTYLAHSRIRSAIVNSPCEHILLLMDVCFGGTISDEVASRGAEEAIYGEASQSEIIIRMLQYRTRKYVTSGGKEYVSDGIQGKHSPFAKQVIEALDSSGGNDGILTLTELRGYLQTLKTAPQFGNFGSDKQGSEFLFVVK